MAQNGAVSANPVGIVIPGLLLAACIAGFAILVSRSFGLPYGTLILAVVTGAAVRSAVGLTPRFDAGISFAGRTLLRLAVVLLGLQITVGDIIQIGAYGILVVCGSLLATYFFTLAVASLLKIDRSLAELVAMGTAICGASAILATRTINRSSEEDGAYAVASVTVIGSALMILLPLLVDYSSLDRHAFGIWIGASLHEVAQVVGAGFQVDQATGEVSVVAKLFRVCLLAPMLVLIAYNVARRSRIAAKAGNVTVPHVSIPWFVLVFVVVAIGNSLIPVSHPVRASAAFSFSLLLAIAMAALGLQSDFRKLREMGMKPFLLHVAATLCILSTSYALARLFI